MQGWLHKRSDGKTEAGFTTGNALPRWSKRYFVLTPSTGHLSYFKDAKDLTKPSGFLEVAGCELKRLPSEPQGLTQRVVASRPSDYIFVVVTGARVLHLAARDETELGEWVSAINHSRIQHQARLHAAAAGSGSVDARFNASMTSSGSPLTSSTTRSQLSASPDTARSTEAPASVRDEPSTRTPPAPAPAPPLHAPRAPHDHDEQRRPTSSRGGTSSSGGGRQLSSVYVGPAARRASLSAISCASSGASLSTRSSRGLSFAYEEPPPMVDRHGSRGMSISGLGSGGPGVDILRSVQAHRARRADARTERHGARGAVSFVPLLASARTIETLGESSSSRQSERSLVPGRASSGGIGSVRAYNPASARASTAEHAAARRLQTKLMARLYGMRARAYVLSTIRYNYAGASLAIELKHVSIRC